MVTPSGHSKLPLAIQSKQFTSVLAAYRRNTLFSVGRLKAILPQNRKKKFFLKINFFKVTLCYFHFQNKGGNFLEIVLSEEE